MTTCYIINRLLILSFMILVGYCLARSIQEGSFMGIVLALVSLLAGIYFLHLLTKANAEKEREESV